MKLLVNLGVFTLILVKSHCYEVLDATNQISGFRANPGNTLRMPKAEKTTTKQQPMKQITFPYTKLLGTPMVFQPYVFPLPKLKPIATTTPKSVTKDSNKFDQIYMKFEGKFGSRLKKEEGKLNNRRFSYQDGGRYDLTSGVVPITYNNDLFLGASGTHEVHLFR